MANVLGNAKEYYNYLSKINQQNNLASQANAREQMAFQREMSNTAHQREVVDLQKAGLNPVLSAGSGGGESSPSGAMGQTDMSTASALTGYLQSLISQQTAMSVAQIQAAATRDAAATSASAAIRVAEISASNPNSWAGLARRLSDRIFGSALSGSSVGGNSGKDLERVASGLGGIASITAKMTGEASLNKPSGFQDWLDRQRVNNPWLYNNFISALEKYVSGNWTEWNVQKWIRENLVGRKYLFG